MRLNGRVLFAGALTAAAVWALVETAGWPLKTSLYPRVVGIPLLILAAAETLLSLRERDEQGSAEAMDIGLSADVPPDLAMRRTLTIAGWMTGLYLAAVLVGLLLAIPLFVAAYLRNQSREGWSLSLLLASLAWASFYLLFVRLLHVPLAGGLLWR
jgi:hypothetical protein